MSLANAEGAYRDDRHGQHDFGGRDQVVTLKAGVSRLSGHGAVALDLPVDRRRHRDNLRLRHGHHTPRAGLPCEEAAGKGKGDEYDGERGMHGVMIHPLSRGAA